MDNQPVIAFSDPAVEAWESRIRRITQQVVDTLIRKHTDYGQSGLRIPALAPWLTPLEGLLCRQSDKFARIGQLSRTGKQSVNESILDTALDQIGYSVLIYIAIENAEREKKQPPTPAESNPAIPTTPATGTA